MDVGVLRAASLLLDRLKLGGGGLTTFGGKRDLFKALGYKEELTAADFRKRYKRNAIAARIVEAMPKATWRGQGELIEGKDNSNDETEFELAWNELDKRLSVWATFLRADILAGLGQYAVILVGAPGNLESPLNKVFSPENIVSLRAYAQDDVTISEIDTDAKSPRFGLPTIYSVKRLSETGSGRRVHFTRIIHVADGLLDDHVYGEPRLERCWNLLDDLDKVTGGGAEAFWLRANQGMQFNIDPEMPVNEDNKKEMIEQIDEYVAGQRRFMRTRGMDIKALGSDVANFDPNASAILEQISGGTGIPKRILTGSELGQLASTQDRLNWAERIIDRRTQYAEPQIVRPFIDLMIRIGGLPEAEYGVRWPKIRDLDASEQAEVANKWADMNKKAGRTVVTVDEIRDHCLGLLPLEKDDVEKMEEVEPTPVEDNGNTGDNTGDTPVAASENDLVDDDEEDVAVAARQMIRRRRLG